MTDQQIHQDVILVRDEVMAAVLFAKEHYALMTYQDMNAKFYCLFAITRRLRKDIRLYYSGKLDVNARKLNEELTDINMYLGDYECFVSAKLRDATAAAGY
jgi:hypothetical protein